MVSSCAFDEPLKSGGIAGGCKLRVRFVAGDFESLEIYFILAKESQVSSLFNTEKGGT